MRIRLDHLIPTKRSLVPGMQKPHEERRTKRSKAIAGICGVACVGECRSESSPNKISLPIQTAIFCSYLVMVPGWDLVGL